MYESHIVCQFYREWGYLDGLAVAEAGIQDEPPISILGNMQNKFDAFFGDTALTNFSRYQLIEFKQDAKGFQKEVMSGKHNRAVLFTHLQKDEQCRQLSYRGHVGGYVEDNTLLFDPYYVLGAANSEHALKQDVPADLFHDFASYYRSWHTPDSNGILQVGLSALDFFRYVHCMYQHLPKDSKGILLIYNEDKKQLVPFYGSIKSLIKQMIKAFKAAIELQTSTTPVEETTLTKARAGQAFRYLASLRKNPPTPTPTPPKP